MRLCTAIQEQVRGTAEAENTVSTADNAEVSDVLFSKPGVSQNVALGASSAARNSAFLMFAFLVHSASLPQSFSSIRWRVARTVDRTGDLRKCVLP